MAITVKPAVVLALGATGWISVGGQLLASGVLLLSGHQDIGLRARMGAAFGFFMAIAFGIFCSGYCDAGKPLVCCRDLCGGSLLRNSVDPALVDSEDFRLGTRMNAVASLPQLAEEKNRHYTQNARTGIRSVIALLKILSGYLWESVI